MTVKSKKIRLRKLFEGEAYTICDLPKGNSSPLDKFINKISHQKKARVMAHLKSLAESGPPRNTERFAHEEDQIYAFKDFQVRIYCFFHREKLIVLTHGTIKKQDKADREDLERAKRLRKEYQESLA